MGDVVIFLHNSSSQSCLKFNRKNLSTSPNPIKSHTNNSNPGPRSLPKKSKQSHQCCNNPSQMLSYIINPKPVYEPARLDAQECHSLLDSDPQRSTREKRRIGYVVDLVIGGMIGAGVLREKLGNQSASTTWKSLQSFFWMPCDHGIGLCFIDFSKWTKLISCESYESMNDKGDLFIFALHTRISWFVRIYCQPPKKNRWLNLKGNAPKNLPSVDVSCHLSCHSYQVGSGSMLQLRPARIMQLRRDGIQLVAAFVDQVAPTVAILGKVVKFPMFFISVHSLQLGQAIGPQQLLWNVLFSKGAFLPSRTQHIYPFEKEDTSHHPYHPSQWSLGDGGLVSWSHVDKVLPLV